MRTTIAELVAVLAMDSTKFQKGLTQAETASMKISTNKLPSSFTHIFRREQRLKVTPVMTNFLDFQSS